MAKVFMPLDFAGIYNNLQHVVNFQDTLQLLCKVSYEIANIFIVALDFHQNFSEFSEIHLGKLFT